MATKRPRLVHDGTLITDENKAQLVASLITWINGKVVKGSRKFPIRIKMDYR